MKELRNSGQRYGTVAIALHWSMALLLVALVVSGLYMVGLPEVGFNTRKITLILYHKELGILALAVVALRFVWRIGNPLPALAESLPQWQKVTARFVHLAFYGLMFALPITGLLMSWAGSFPVSFFGLFDLPDLIAPSDRLFQVFIQVHKWLGFGLIAFMAVHVGAALWHHFVIKDATLKKMLLRADP
jgi:cytochrome b561